MNYSDPLHQLVADYREAEAALNTSTDENHEQANAAFGTVFDRVKQTDAVATSYAGAMAALRMAASDINGVSSTETIEPLLRGALAYFDSVEAICGNTAREAYEMAEHLNLTEIDGSGWTTIHNTLLMLQEAADGILSQPRCQGKGLTTNPAGDYISSIADFLTHERRRVMEAAKLYQHRPDEDPESLNRLILQWEAFDADLNFEQIAVLAIRMGDQQRAFEKKGGKR